MGQKEILEKKAMQRNAKYGRLGLTAQNDPAAVKNEVKLSGYITNIRVIGKGENSRTIFNISVNHREMKKDKNGKFQRTIVPVVFFQKEGQFYQEKFSIKDLVIVTGVLQTVTNPRYVPGRKDQMPPKRTEVWGETMQNAKNNLIARDYTSFELCGRIEDCKISERNNGPSLINLLVKTQIWKERKNVIDENTDIPNEDLYRSSTRVQIYAGKEKAKQITNFRLTKGTVVDITGHLQSKVQEIKFPNGKSVHNVILSAVAENITAVGEIQSPAVDPVTKVTHLENSNEDSEKTARAYSSDEDDKDEN